MKPFSVLERPHIQQNIVPLGTQAFNLLLLPKGAPAWGPLAPQMVEQEGWTSWLFP